MASKPKTLRKRLSSYRKRNKRLHLGALQKIVFRLERGDISVNDAYNEVQEVDRAQRSRLDRILEAIVG